MELLGTILYLVLQLPKILKWYSSHRKRPMWFKMTISLRLEQAEIKFLCERKLKCNLCSIVCRNSGFPYGMIFFQSYSSLDAVLLPCCTVLFYSSLLDTFYFQFFIPIIFISSGTSSSTSFMVFLLFFFSTVQFFLHFYHCKCLLHAI